MIRILKTGFLAGCAGLMLLLCGLQQEAKAACLTSEGAIIKMGDWDFMRINYQSQLEGEWRDTGSGPEGEDPTTNFFFRRNRLSIGGQESEQLGFSLKLEQEGESRIGTTDVSGEPSNRFDVLEAYVTGEFSPSFNVYAGKTKVPFTREVLEGCFSGLTLDRSLFIHTPMRATRDTGLLVWGNMFRSKFQYIAAVQQGRESADSPGSMPRFTGRAHLTLLDPENEFGYDGTYLGNRMVFTVGAAAQYEPDVVYSDVVNKTGIKKYTAWTADAFLEYPVGDWGAVTLSAAYVDMSFDDAYKGNNPDPESTGLDGQKKGWYAKTGYTFINKIGPGQFQPFVRYEDWNFAQLNGVYSQKVRWIGAGMNYLINGQNLKFTLQYALTDFNSEENPESNDFTTITAMLQFGF